jgi:HEAT repeat protein
VSDPAAISRFFEADPADAGDIARALFVEGRAAPLNDRLLHELTSDSTWARDQALARLCALSDYEPLLEPLAASLSDDDDAERRNAARSALAALAGARAKAPVPALRLLFGLLGDDSESDVRLLAASALGESGNPKAREALEGALDDPEANVVSAAADALGILGDVRAVPALERVAREGDFWTRVAAVVSLGRLGDARALPTLAAALREPWLMSAAADALGEIGDPAALDALRERLAEEGGGRENALRAIAGIYSSHPGHPVPDWLRSGLAGEEAELERRLIRGDDPEAGRLLGLTGSAAAAAALVRSLSLPGREDAVAAGLALLPREIATDAIIERLSAGKDDTRILLLGALPPLDTEASIAVVVEDLSDPDPEVRAAAAEALARSGEALVVPALERAIRDPAAQHGAALAYSRLGGSRCEPLLELLRSESAPVRTAAAEGLGRCGDRYVAQLREAIRSERDASARRALVRSLGASRTLEAVEELVPLLESDDPGTRFAAVQALGRTGLPAAFEPLVSALADAREEIRASALVALGEIGDPRAGGPLAEHLGVPDRDLRRTAIFALDRIERPAVTQELLTALRDPDREVRLTAVRVLHRLRLPEAGAALRQVADYDPEPLVRQAADSAISGLDPTSATGPS